MLLIWLVWRLRRLLLLLLVWLLLLLLLVLLLRGHLRLLLLGLLLPLACRWRNVQRRGQIRTKERTSNMVDRRKKRIDYLAHTTDRATGPDRQSEGKSCCCRHRPRRRERVAKLAASLAWRPRCW